MKIELLDHGYCELIETWGSDQSIIEAARMSTNKGFLGWGPTRACSTCGCRWRENPPTEVQPNGSWSLADGEQKPGKCCDNVAMHLKAPQPGDERLLKFLYDNKHSTPFEMAGLTIEVKAPIMVFREWHRHRVPFGYNEMSARYVPLPDENYSPTIARVVEGAQNAGKNKQAQGSVAEVPSEVDVRHWLDRLYASYKLAQEVYEEGLDIGVPKELARLPVPVARYSRMRATGNLRGWLGFLTLRSAPNAQYEIRVYADVVGKFIEKSFPRTWELFAGARS
jgi:thymidylate synthase (FAD)